MAKVPQKPKKEPLGARFLFIMGGVIWGLVMAPDLGLSVAKFVGGLDWPGIAGTREWPAWADWVIVAAGVATGLTVFFTALIVGRNVGDRFEYSRDLRLQSGSAVPWAVIAVGITVGGITTLTIDERRQAVVDYVQEQKDALLRLQAFARDVDRFGSVRVDWPGGGEEGRVSISFRGNHRGDYLLDWEIRDSSNGKTPVMEGSIGAALSPGEQKTDLPLSPRALVSAWQRRAGNVADATVDEDFTFRARLIPQLSRKEWAPLPRHEPDNLAAGDSILIDRASDSFPVYFELRGGRIIWSRE